MKVLEWERTSQEEEELDPDNGLIHTMKCHDDYTALCGTDLSGVEGWIEDSKGPPTCLVCAELELLPCSCDCGCCISE